MNFIEAALKYKQVTLAILLMLFAIGANSLLNMPRREDPKITIRTGLVIASFPGASSVQVEEQVTRKLEQYLFHYEEVDKAKTYSTTKDGNVVVNVELTENVKQPDIFWNKLRHQLLFTREVDLPKGVIGPMVDSDFGDTEAIVVALESGSASYEELKSYAQKTEDLLRKLRGASKVKRIGDQGEELLVSSTSERLAQYDLNFPQVMRVLQAQNTISPSGEIKTAANQTPMYANGYFRTENDLAEMIIGHSQEGLPIRLGNVATVERKYNEPESTITVNGNKALLLAIQMYEGNNIVDFGKAVEATLNQAREFIPSKVKLTTLVSQPAMVHDSISHFIKEFFLAILSVIVVIILLLPFRIAAVAATAIPMTVALTFALLNVLGIELHQVSLAGLILVLGMVVDDAIVIADNYVELLDEGVDRWQAAWRCAYDLLVPVLTATVTIIAAFMPMTLIKGSTGEFIFSLPITVAVALLSSYFVALILTPLLCYTFIKKGLHQPVTENGQTTQPQKKSLLTYMQSGYERTLNWAVQHPKTTIITSVVFVLLTGLVFKLGVRELFFPPAERNQFVIELRMPTGTKLEKTSAAIHKAEELIRHDKRLTSYATFTGTSAPRFYYNFSPELPASNYALILLNTVDVATAETMAEELSSKVNNLVPEGTFFVKLMQQGNDLKAPVEVRIVGEDIAKLKTIAAQISQIMKNQTTSRLVRSDNSEDYYALLITPNEEGRRMGYTTESIAQQVSAGFAGTTVSTLYEGNKPVNIVFRLNAAVRRNTTDLQSMYLTSPLSNVSVPLAQIAEFNPQWFTGKIIRRNGVRAITIQSEIQSHALPAELLKSIRPDVNRIHLPVGYHIEYAGEEGGKAETESDLGTALSISLVLIFFILLFQFRNIKEVLIIMATIPLSLFGAVAGLAVTGNNFSFTAFIGLISLSGIVVRNAIILIDHTNLLIKQGEPIYMAAMEAAKRRLRPIFLTAMSAAVGVLPMIISGSPMWAPLASVLAFGVVWSMIMALLTVPVMYIGCISTNDKKYHFPETITTAPNEN